MKLNEDRLNEQIARGAHGYAQMFPDIFESVADDSPLARNVGFNTYEQYALGRQLAQVKDYIDFYMNEAGGTGDLGVLPNIALDLVAMQYSTGIMPLIASVQPIEDENGTIYWKTFRAETTRGTAVAGQSEFLNPLQRPDDIRNFATEAMTQKIADLADTTVDYTLAAGSAPDLLRPNTIRVSLSDDPAVRGIDDGAGNIVGPGMTGTVNYATGEISIHLASNPGDGGTLDFSYGLDYGEGAVVPKISRILKSKRVFAQIYAIATQISLFQNYAMRRRFGEQSEEELITDLSNLINAELGNHLLAHAWNGTPTANMLTWDSTNVNLSATDRAIDLKRTLSEMDAQIVNTLGYGSANWYTVDPKAAVWVPLIPGFEPVPQTIEFGPQLIGYLDAKPVIQWPFQTENTIMGGFKGTNPFSASLIYAPYMPVVTTSALPGSNEVTQRGMAATWGYVGTSLNTSDLPNAECKGLARVTIIES